MALITLTTDFGTADPFVGIMRGVIATRAPGVAVIDVSHGVPPQDILAGALVLAHAAPWFPAGTIHVAVVDPGVGSARRPLCVETADALFVGPDNGLLSLAAPARAVRRIVHLTETRFFLPALSATFHGRDVFAPVAAALATGTPADALGPLAPDMVRLSVPAFTASAHRIGGAVVYVDGFGNLVTNVPERALAAFPRPRVSITIGGVRIRGIEPCYAAAPPGALVAVVNSWGLLEIAARDASARATLGADIGTPVTVEVTEP